jgi:hypothetical protein
MASDLMPKGKSRDFNFAVLDLCVDFFSKKCERILKNLTIPPSFGIPRIAVSGLHRRRLLAGHSGLLRADSDLTVLCKSSRKSLMFIKVNRITFFVLFYTKIYIYIFYVK